ncbi:hypothetical protein LTR09_007515 [Extremus antarcticus]|uniref:Uncharacterized protein n=1 Tax=Extremus antarcticus TaxID=702011 RepID=A0AAJ0GB34_9PEZI|nr:hypothetical protein LTR09_007515 [Extremus antarcticus]
MASIHTNPSTHTLSSNDPPSSTYSNIPQIWPFHWSTFNPFNRPSFDDRMRRISMITILTARTFLDIPALYLFARRLEIPNLVLYLAIDVIAFVFIAWCLSVIGEAQGERRVLGKRVGRWHLDAFLLVTALVHVLLLVGQLSGLALGFGVVGPYGSIWLLTWLLLVGVT